MGFKKAPGCVIIQDKYGGDGNFFSIEIQTH